MAKTQTGSIRLRPRIEGVIATADYELLTKDAGIVERADRTVIELSGAEAAEFLQGQVTNDVEGLEPGQGCYATLLDHKGKLRTDMRVLRLASDRLLVDAEPAARRALMHNFETYSLGREARSRDVTDDHVVLSLIGPAAREPARGCPRPRRALLRGGAAGLYVTTDVGVDLIVPVARRGGAGARTCRERGGGRDVRIE